MPNNNNQEAAVAVDALRTELGNAWASFEPPDAIWRVFVSILAIMILGMWTVRTLLSFVWAVVILLYAVLVVFVSSRKFSQAKLARTELSIAFSFTRWCVSWAFLVNSLLGLTFVLIAVRFLAGNALSGNPEIGLIVDSIGAIAIILMIPVTPMLCKVLQLQSLRTTLEVTVDLQGDRRVQVTLLFCGASFPKPGQAEVSRIVESIRKVFSALYQ